MNQPPTRPNPMESENVLRLLDQVRSGQARLQAIRPRLQVQLPAPEAGES